MKQNILNRATGFALVVAISTAGALAQNGWVRQSPFPSDRSAKNVFAISPEKAFFVGDANLIVETTNAGDTLSVRHVGDFGQDPYYAVYFMTPQIGLITGNNTCLRTADGGASWTPVSFFAGSWYHLDFISPTVGFAGANGALVATSDGGLTWSVRSGYPDCPVMFGMDFRDADTGIVGGLIAGTEASGIFKTSDGGRTWELKANGAANDVVWMSNTRAIADYSTTIRESLDAGETWHTINSGIDTGLASMTRAGNGSLVLGVSMAGDVWRSTDGGHSWVQTFDGPGSLPDIWEISFADDLHGWIVGPGGFYYYSNDGGITWQQKNSGCTAQIWDIQMLDSNYGLAIGQDGYVFRTTDGGGFWDIQKLEVTGQIFGRDEGLVAVDIVDADFAAVAGPGGTVFKTLDGGRNWTSIGYPNLTGDLYIYDVDFIDRDLGYVYGVNAPFDQKFLFRTRNGGASWEWVDMGNIGGGTTAQFVDAQYGWLTADNDFGWRTTNGGVNWTSFRMPGYFTGPEVSKVRFLDRNNGWAVGWTGYVAKTSNGGVTWSLVNINTTEDDLFDVIPVSTSEIWMCGRENWSQKGVMYHSINGGQTWTRQVVTDWFYYPYRMTALQGGDAWFGGFMGSIFRRDMGSEFGPGGFSVVRGRLVAGDLASLQNSDDNKLIVEVGNVPEAADPIRVQLDGTAQFANPSELRFKVESSANRNGIRQKVLLFNFQSNGYELVRNDILSLTDGTIEVIVSSNAGRFVEPGSNAVRARLYYQPVVPQPTPLWRIAIDQTRWTLR